MDLLRKTCSSGASAVFESFFCLPGASSVCRELLRSGGNACRVLAVRSICAECLIRAEQLNWLCVIVAQALEREIERRERERDAKQRDNIF